MIDTAKLVRWYDAQARFYSLRRDRDGGALIDAVRPAARALAPGARLLDAGCGSGLFAVALASDRPDVRVHGVDGSGGMLRVARERAARRGLGNLTLARADAARLPLAGGSIDLAIAAGLLPVVPDRPAVLRELRRVVRPGGRLLVVEVDRESLGAGGRLAFRTMILGWRIVAAVWPRFRFADAWDLERSTLEAPVLVREARAAGFSAAGTTRAAGHLLLSCVAEG